MHEPQFVPAFNAAPRSAAERMPPAIASQIVVRPTPKQTQTTGPALGCPDAALPDNSERRWSSPSSAAAKSSFTKLQSAASRAGPRNKQVSSASPANDAAR